MQRFLRRIQYWFRVRRLEADIAEELEVHRAMTQEKLERDGLSAADAFAASRRALGNVTLAREEARAAWIWPWVQGVRQDATYALRAMRHQPGFSLLAIGTLAAAIGLNTAVFTVYSALTMRPWPVRNPQQVVTIYNLSDRDRLARGGGGPYGFSLAETQYFAEHSKTVSAFIVMRSGGGDKTLGEDDTPAAWVSGNYFSVLGVEMAAGRGFSPEEDRAESPVPVAVLSYGYWQRRFGGDPALTGKSVLLEDVPFTVIGIASQAFTGTSVDRVDIWMPISSSVLLRPDDRWVLNVARKPEACCLSVAGRLVAGATREQARAELTVLDRQYRGGRDTGASTAGGIRIDGTQADAGPRGGAGSTFTPIFAGVVLVLLLACANVGNLLLARAAARRREIGVRLALGAGRARVVRQLLTESLALALLSGCTGLMVALWLPAQIVGLLAGPNTLNLRPDAAVLGYALGLSLLSCLVFGLAPALHGTRSSVGNALKAGIPTAGSRLPLRSLLLAIQVAVTVVLLAASALLARAVYDASMRDHGFSLRDMSVVSFEAPSRGYDATRIRALALELADAVEAAGDSHSVALTSTEPLGSGNIKGSFRISGLQEDQNNSVYEVSPAYFDLLGLDVVAGRPLAAADVNKPVVVISETMAKKYWTIPSAVGQRILVDPARGGWNTPGELEIVGVVEDVHQTSLEEPDSTIYQPLSGRLLPRVLVRSSSVATTAAVTAAAARIDPRLRARVRPLVENLRPRLSSARTGAVIAGALGGLALMLASVGMIGVFSYWVQQRTREIGIRMALGARSPQVVHLLLGSSARSLLAGTVCGIVGAGSASGLLRSYLFGLNPLDPIAYSGVVALLVVAACAATYWPARRATRVDPVVALRCE
jgi:macrolide transport system ATP-binding/permease protein